MEYHIPELVPVGSAQTLVLGGPSTDICTQHSDPSTSGPSDIGELW